MKYLLDTNICIYLIKQKPAQLLQKFSTFAIGEIGISAITVSELWYGVAKSQNLAQNSLALEQFLLPLVIAAFDLRATQQYGMLRSWLEKKGQPIGNMDLLIAAHALSLDITLVTNNLREFGRIPHLRLENWAE